MKGQLCTVNIWAGTQNVPSEDLLLPPKNSNQKQTEANFGKTTIIEPGCLKIVFILMSVQNKI